MLDADPLSALTGALDERPEVSILLALLHDARERVGEAALRRWVRAPGPAGRPIDALLARDFGAFERALEVLARRGIVVRGGGEG